LLNISFFIGKFMSKKNNRPLIESNLLSPAVSFGIVNQQYDLSAWEAIAKDSGKGALYARNSSNPSAGYLEEQMRQLELAEFSTTFSSGMAAISNVLFALLSPGQRLVVGRDTYGGASYLFTHALPKWGVKVEMVDTLDHSAFEQAIALGCDVLYLETPTNPLLKIQNIKLLSAMAHQQGGTVVIDNTLATSINQQPITLGADVVMHSATKFLGGHADALGGVVCTSQALGETLLAHKEIHGACLDPMSAYLISRGVKTLALRMKQHNENALVLAKWLDEHPAVHLVNYPGLISHSGHALAQQQMNGFGGVLSFSLNSGAAGVYETFKRFDSVVLASTLGSVETMVGTPSTTSHVECTEEERKALGIPDGLVRCSVGIETIDDIIADFDQALNI
jgi:cystathionine gamma-synthase